MCTEWRLELSEERRRVLDGYLPCHPAMAGGIVAQQQNEIGSERVGGFDNTLEMRQAHIGFAHMDIGQGRDAQLEIRRPALRRQFITLHAQKKARLDAEAIGGYRGARQNKTA